VLIVDDSVVMRRMLSDTVSATGVLEVSGTAPSADIALQKIAQTNPDAVLLDIEMPGMDGIKAVAEIRKLWPKMPVLMCSALTRRGGEMTLKALAAGASDYVAKPDGSDLALFARELVAKLVSLTTQAQSEGPLQPLSGRTKTRGIPRILAVGASTGGPNVVTELFERLPTSLPMPVVLALHMPAMFTKVFAERLSATTKWNVHEAVHGEPMLPGRGYLAPGGLHLVVEGTAMTPTCGLSDAPPENSCRPAVDVLFRSVARVYGADSAALVLTGMGKDGALGARAIADAGGYVLVQDFDTCVVASMPRAVVDIGASHQTVRPEAFASLLQENRSREVAP